ncbi:MAG: DUF1598 domain-containing protein [Pirellulales bacterium]|nr:DUF1598 domain-containing protein [Pirellulales bacterium]
MRLRGHGVWPVWLLAALFAFFPATASAQDDNGDDDDGGGASAGIVIDANGVLHKKIFSDRGGQVMRERIASARATLDPKLASYSKLRKVSLNRLEKVILDRQGVLTDEMRYLAGLLRVRYIFFYPDSKDIVLAGPAEGWAPDPSGRIVGITSGRPTVQLQDLAVALRMFPPDGAPTKQIGCSIDPTPEGLAAMEHFVKNNFPSGDLYQFAEAIRQARGLQIVRIDGVPPKTHFAQVMVEADYRMKLIGIGLEEPPVRMVSFIDRAAPGELGANGMGRWFFVPDYQCVRQSEDGLGMELVGDGVKLIGEREAVSAEGQRSATSAGTSRASQAFVTSFTRKYPALAERSPVFAELRNLIDLAVAAAYIQEEDYYGKADWNMPFLGSEKQFPVEVYDVPKMAESAVNVVRKGNSVMFPAAGGVQIDATAALDYDNVLPDKKEKVAKLHEQLKPDLAEGQWWWD